MTWISNSVGYVIHLVSLSDFVTFSLTKIPPCVFTIFLKLSLDAAIKKELRLDQFSRSFPAIRLFWQKKQIFDFVTFSFLFWLNSSNFGLGWRKRRTLKAKKTRQIVVVSHLQICPRPLQQFTFRSSVELLSVRVLLLLHCNCWTDL